MQIRTNFKMRLHAAFRKWQLYPDVAHLCSFSHLTHKYFFLSFHIFLCFQKYDHDCALYNVLNLQFQLFISFLDFKTSNENYCASFPLSMQVRRILKARFK